MEAGRALDMSAFSAASMAPSEKATPSWSTNDRACNHCRERKIRCGREKPQCSNCKRDVVDCVYVYPGKRVNHVKLLCSNVGSLDDRLSDIEGELSRLAALIKTSGSQRASVDESLEEEFPGGFSGDDLPSAPPTDRHIVRSQIDLIDRYHGPCTVFALCNEFRQNTLSEQQIQSLLQAKDEPQGIGQQGTSVKVKAVKDLLERLCQEAVDEPFDHHEDSIPIRIPPKQILLMAQTQFFSQAHYTTNIFVQSSFCSHVDRLYSRPFNPADEAWAVCFHTIILLILGSESTTRGNNLLVESQFALPFRLTVRTAITNPRALLEPKLINVQALTLLSIAAQEYYPPSFLESIFVQACVLARRMGLHQTHSGSDGITPEEAQERFMVFRSLYLRDKSYLISRGSICWLPTFDSNLSCEVGKVGFTDTNYSARIQLATLQEDIYRSFRSAESQKQSPAKRKSSLTRIEQNLERWANAHDVFNSPSSGTSIRSIDLRLEFLATRISAFCASSEPGHIRQAIIDSRASCLILLLSHGKHEESTVERLEALLPSKSLSKSLGNTDSSRSGKRNSSDKAPAPKTGAECISESAPLQFHNLPDTFSVPAFFILAKNILLSDQPDDSRAEDVSLLQKVCVCYKELDARTRSNNRTRNVGRAFERLLEIVNLLRNFQQHQASPQAADGISNTNAQSNSQDLFGSLPALTDFMYLPTPSAYSTPLMPSWDNLSMQAMGATDAESLNGPHGLLSPMDMEFFGQRFDSPQQQYPLTFSAPESRKRARLSNAEMSLLSTMTKST